MERVPINPWTWQDPYGFAQAWKVSGAQSLIFVSGQASISPEGRVLHEGDIRAQVRLAFENLRTVLEKAGASLDDVVKLGAFLVDREHVPPYVEVHSEFFAGRKPAQTLVQVASLALPGMLAEVEALAVR